MINLKELLNSTNIEVKKKEQTFIVDLDVSVIEILDENKKRTDIYRGQNCVTYGSFNITKAKVVRVTVSSTFFTLCVVPLNIYDVNIPHNLLNGYKFDINTIKYLYSNKNVAEMQVLIEELTKKREEYRIRDIIDSLNYGFYIVNFAKRIQKCTSDDVEKVRALLNKLGRYQDIEKELIEFVLNTYGKKKKTAKK